MRITITTNLDNVGSSFKERLGSVSKEEMFDEIAFYMENEMRKRFDAETDYEGNAWEKLKLRKGKILSDTGALKGSLGIAKIERDSVSVFSNLVYAKIHDEGGVIKAKNVKALHWKIGKDKYFAKSVTIISQKGDQIAEYIITHMHRGVTGLDAKGMYTKKGITMLYCVLSNREVSNLKDVVNEMDDKAFFIIADVREAHGEGFIRRDEMV